MQPQIHRDVKVYNALSSGLLPTRPLVHMAPELTDDLWDFMMQCWSADPRLRPAMSDARNFLAQVERRQGSNSSVAEVQMNVYTPSFPDTSYGRRLSEPQVGGAWANSHTPLVAGTPSYGRRMSDAQSSGYAPSIADLSSHGRRPSDAQISGYSPSIADSTYHRRRSDAHLNIYAPSVAESSLSSGSRSYSRLSLSPQYSEVSGTTAFSTPNSSTKTPSTAKPHPPAQSKPSSPPNLNLGPPYHSPSSMTSARSRVPDLQATSPFLGGPLLASNIPVAPTYLEPISEPEPTATKKVPSPMWISRPLTPTKSQLRDNEHPPPGKPLAPMHILSTTEEETLDSITVADDFNGPSVTVSSPPPAPAKDGYRPPPTVERQNLTPFVSSPEHITVELPPIPQTTSSDSSTEARQEHSRSQPSSLWKRIRRKGSRIDAPEGMFHTPVTYIFTSPYNQWLPAQSSAGPWIPFLHMLVPACQSCSLGDPLYMRAFQQLLRSGPCLRMRDFP
jgi:hypothetical protein